MIRAIAASLAGAACLGAAVLVTGAERGEARDFGQLGQTFPVVEAALAGDLGEAVEIVSLNPMRLGEVWASIRRASPRPRAPARHPKHFLGQAPAQDSPIAACAVSRGFPRAKSTLNFARNSSREKGLIKYSSAPAA